MRKVYRREDNAAYWDRRWTEADRDSERFTDLSIYPIKYAEMVMTTPGAEPTLEIGCGLGRVLKHYARDGHQIVGIERSEVAVRRINEEMPELDVRHGDVLDLPFEDGEFNTILAFGVYHNLDEGLNRALAETARCLNTGGRFCVSMRPDNIEMRLNELYWRLRQGAGQERRFHKLLVRKREFERLLAGHRLMTRRVYPARNISLLYRVAWLRDRSQTPSETARRSEGYRLNTVGSTLDRLLTRMFPFQSANVLVYVGVKAR